MTKQHKLTSRTVKHLIQNATKGNFESSFQLYRNYSEGKNVEQKDDELANKYFAEVENALINKKLSLISLQLSDFRRFRKLNINFDENITVIIGDNGAGKTSIAEAIARVFTWLNNNLEKPDVNGRPIVDSEVHVKSTEYAEISSSFKFDKKNIFNAVIGKVVPGYTGSSTTDVKSIKQLANMYKYTAKNKAVMIPLLAFYSVERSDFTLKESVPDKVSDNTASNRFANINTALEGSGKLEDFSKLYIELVNLASGKDTEEIKNLKNDISSLEATIFKVHKGVMPSSDDPYLDSLNEQKAKLAILLQSTPSRKYQRHLDFVNLAIETLVPEVKNLEVDRSTGKSRILVENFGIKVNISQLSQGQKMLAALTGDLARRLVTLNPDADEPLHGHGIVVIDEVELHLHPKWQQEILIGLQKTFPNIQFIVTTHSPQVLSTVDHTCIRQIYLDQNSEPKIKVPPFQTKGVTSASILARIMGTDSVPQNIPEALLENSFYELIVNNKYDELFSVLEDIKGHFGEDHPVTMKCIESLNVYKLKRKYLAEKE